MTVKELIDALKTFPPNADVWTYQQYPGSFWVESADFEEPDENIPDGMVTVVGSNGPLIGDMGRA